ncbi:hypothetical protein [Duganella callida]|uniref:Uncharacterized protein n=1 Tax=Duganella callida TaxID=2561932 RepID=A0A4Y9SRG8_9BURK|nr:hypothetical protein [Duganella callida]TFW29065.1 hypothetical protein E4L98_04790 [Duganella callida]
MTPSSLLDIESGRSEDDSLRLRETIVTVAELAMSVEVIKSNYVTKEELAIVSGKIDLVANNLQAFPAHAYQTFATKADLADAVTALTWRFIGFAAILLSGGFALGRYL